MLPPLSFLSTPSDPLSRRRQYHILMALLAIGCAVLLSLQLNTGSLSISRDQLAQALMGQGEALAEQIVWELRLPRALLGMMAGAALALSGALMQGLTRNPLADPGLLGIGAGAALASATLIIIWPNLPRGLLIPAALVGALLVAWLTWRLSRRHERSMARLLLAGLALNSLVTALLTLMTWRATGDQLRWLLFWQLGSLERADWPLLGVMGSILLFAIIRLNWLARGLDLLSMGEASCRHLGWPVQRLQRETVFWIAVLTATSVALCGLIGFIGLILPHILRLIVGPGHTRLLPLCMIGGAALLLLADLLGRTLLAPQILPPGLMLALIGTPLFIHLLLGRRALPM
ncbi:FecCD family ABC transporter permease [Terasakiispira papahanaumokuakeensis]|nr:iron ABC transporter permease [Terasakiispira papahanaumokuakeensis]